MKVLILSPLFLIGASEQYNWILSATAQSLAAVFALYFTVLIFSTQAVSRYNPRAFEEVFVRIQTLFLFSLFGTAIILPLIFLHDPSELKAWIAIAIGGACLVFLVLDVLTDLGRKLMPSRYVTSLVSEAKRNSRRVPEILDTLKNVAIRLYETDPVTFKKAVTGVGDIMCKYKDEDVGKKALKTLENLAKETVEHPSAPVEIASTLTDSLEKAKSTQIFSTFEKDIVTTAQDIERLCVDKYRDLSLACFRVIAIPFECEDLSPEFTGYLEEIYTLNVNSIINKHNNNRWFDLAEEDVKILKPVVFGLAKRDSEKLQQTTGLFNIPMQTAVIQRGSSAKRLVWGVLLEFFEYAIKENPSFITLTNKLWIYFWNYQQATEFLETEDIDRFTKLLKEGIKVREIYPFMGLVTKLKEYITRNSTDPTRKELVLSSVALLIIDILELIIKGKLLQPEDSQVHQLFDGFIAFCRNIAPKNEIICMRILRKHVKLIRFLDGASSEKWGEKMFMIQHALLHSWIVTRSDKIGKFVCPYIWLIRSLYLKPKYGNPNYGLDEILRQLSNDRGLTDFFFTCVTEAKKLVTKYKTEDEFEKAQEELRRHLNPSA